jgi:hypothetical protein
MDENHKSRVLLLSILLALLLVTACGGGWYLWHKNKTSEPQETALISPLSLEKTDSNTKYFTIVGYNVRLPLTDELADLKEGATVSSIYEKSDLAIEILAPQLDKDWGCAGNSGNSKGTIGNISITKNAKRAGPGAPATSKKIGEYTYGFEPGGSNCTKNPKFAELVSDFTLQFDLLESFK